jgi:hypothetical protein
LAKAAGVSVTRYLGVFISVFITFATAWILNYAADDLSLSLYDLCAVLIVVVVLNGTKFVIWGALNKRFKLSDTYPLTALFFPLIFVFAIVSGDAELTLNKVAGLCLIVTGFYFFEKSRVEG